MYTAVTTSHIGDLRNVDIKKKTGRSCRADH